MSDSVGSVSVDVVPDARGWSEKLRAQIRDATATVEVDADTGEAEAQIDETARTRTAKIRVNVDKNPLEQGASALDSFVGKLGLLPALAIAAGAALTPLVGVIGGIAAALAAPIAIAGGGATLFALLGGFAVKQTQAQLKAIDDQQKKLDGLTKGTKEYAQAQKDLHVLQAGLSPAQEHFATSLDRVKGAFAGLLAGSAGQSLLDPFGKALDLLARLLPTVTPLIESVSGAFDTLLGDLGDATRGRGFKDFIDQFARLAGRDIVVGGHILGDLARGVGGLLTATDKGFSGGFLHGLHQLTANFADWANSREARHDMRDFFDYVHDVGPQVGDTIGAIARALGHVVKALAPLGPPILSAIENMADGISNIPVPVLTALAAAFTSIVAFQKLGGFKGLSALGGLAGLKGGGPLGGALSKATGVVPVFVTNWGKGGIPGIPGVPEGEAAKTGFLGKFLRFAGAATIGGSLLYGGDKLASAEGKSPLIALPAILGVAVQEMRSTNKLANYLFHQKPATAPPPGAPSTPQAIEAAITLRRADIPELRSTAGAFDAVKAHAAAASRQIDLIGPHAQASSLVGQRAMAALQSKIDAIHDKHFRVIAETQSAVQSLERLQAMRIEDKHFTVYQRFQQIERTVGPGGGQGQNPHGSDPDKKDLQSGNGGGGRTPVHLHLDENGRRNITGWLEDGSDRVYRANRDYENQAAGR